MVQFRWYNNQTKCGKLGVVSMSSNRILEILEDYLAWAQLDKQHHKRISEMEGTELYEYLDRATIFIQYRTRALEQAGL